MNENTKSQIPKMIFDAIFTNIVGIGIALMTIIIVYYKWRYQYWKRKNMPYLEPSIPYGNSASPLRRKEHSAIRLKRNYDYMKSKGWKHGGLFTMLTPAYLVIDLDYLKNIMTKDFQHFVDRGFYYNEKDDPLSAHLFAIGGQKWRNLRTKLTPTFTSGKMKMMFQTLVDCVPYFLEKIETDRVNQKPIDIKETLGCFTTDIIGSCAFGLECNTFKEENSPFREYGRKFFEMSRFSMLKTIFSMNFPNVARTLGVSLTPKDISNFFIKVVNDTVTCREKNNFTRKDFMQLLIDLKNNKLAVENGYKHDGNTLTNEEIAAQSFVFFIAGFETSSTTMTFALYELSKNHEIQDRVRNEINTVLAKYDGKITYEAIQEMKYMDLVINETLRKYPPVATLTRQCVKDYKIPDEDIIIEKGTFIEIPVFAIHHDKDHYPDPEKFDPERFTEENKSKRHHYAHIPFGEGPRICIGARFGLMQSKVGLTSLLRNYKFKVNQKTMEPLKMKVKSFILAAEGEVWLDAEKI
ncbi:cytochrome P450 6a2-like isoform X2 [Zophobas morio]|uniref:cytochrome P450 6a2-like isoform X2 n=1 Tax=Zophobas morio TaxID=2755281 RepID=UPI0030829C4C